MQDGKRINVGEYNDYEVITINGEDYINLKYLPDIVRLLYGRKIVDTVTRAINDIEFKYDEKSGMIDCIDTSRAMLPDRED